MVRSDWKSLDWTAVTVALIGVLLGIGTWTLVQIRDVATLLSQEPFLAQENAIMQTLTSTWLSGGVNQSITSTREEGESTQDFILRHKEALDAAVETWPVDPPK